METKLIHRTTHRATAIYDEDDVIQILEAHARQELADKMPWTLDAGVQVQIDISQNLLHSATVVFEHTTEEPG